MPFHFFFREIERDRLMINKQSFKHKSAAMIFTVDSQSAVV